MLGNVNGYLRVMATLTLVNSSVYWNGTTIPYTASRCCCDGEFPGAGWYCIFAWTFSDYSTCTGTMTCSTAYCQYVADQAEWDALAFGADQYYPLPFPWCYILTTDYVKHSSEGDCLTAGCECALD